MVEIQSVMRNICLNVAYDGSAYHGWQRQINALAIQQVMEQQMAKVFGSPVVLAAAGRTDTGVHARGQVVSFRTASKIPVSKIVIAINGLLPADIRVLSAKEVAMDFHARVSASGKSYSYTIQTGAVANPFRRNQAWFVHRTLNIKLMRTALTSVIGEHDFSSFRAAGSTITNPVRTIFQASVEKLSNCPNCGEDLLRFEFIGNGFLYHMVRNLIGTLALVGWQKISPFDFGIIMAGCDRRFAGMTAPPQGLCLEKVFYEKLHYIN